ncbi:SGNH hydrolase-type esterase domain-containing protein [Lasiosphaeris hirsuta]|uniref:SGNH hydrolase-type esterase domain-containing protein n=1 Tax=Lasiosphaeris hirsuta TaxID=260670 RepID=A0AA40DG58_9PEZI|nr:SGNH hydrolase-type esterase domain-containing protein [Lasiosphaeris hirsuta]
MASTAAIVVEVENILGPLAKFKARSHETSKTQHIQLLSSSNENSPTVVLLGDSMLERMITTGQSPSLTVPWPSEIMLSSTALATLALDRLKGVLNVGVGGDKIQNIAYRLVGDADPDPSKTLSGLAAALAAHNSVKLWVVQAGTNNLSPKMGLTDADCKAMGVLLRGLLRLSSPQPESKVLLTGLFPRTDISVNLVDIANQKLAAMAREVNLEIGKESIFFLPPTKGVETQKHLEDHVHLNLHGYTIWVEELLPAVAGLLEKIVE